jgi:hypothetical protein
MVAATPASLEQESYRFRADDGSETSATWLASQDTDITRPVNTNTRLRIILNANSDPASGQYQLEYKKSSGSTYGKVYATQPGTSIPTFVSKGTFTSGTAALTVPVPSGYADNDIFLLFVETANQAITTPAGWTQVTNSPQSTGTAAAAGGVRLAVFWKLVSGTQSSVSVADSGDHQTAIIMCFRGCDTTTPIHISAGSVDASATSSLSCTAVTTTINNCLIINAIGLDKDLASTNTLSAVTNSNLSSLTKQHDQTVASGFGGGLAVITGGLATAGGTGNTTATGDTSTTHAYLTLALAPLAPPSEAILLGSSANISSGGATATTAQLTAPSGKSSGTDFQAGEISDDTNALPALDLASDKYTELEWCITAVSGVAANGDVYQFRVTINGTAIDTYTVTPQWTIGTSGTTYSDSSSGGAATSGSISISWTGKSSGGGTSSGFGSTVQTMPISTSGKATGGGTGTTAQTQPITNSGGIVLSGLGTGQITITGSGGVVLSDTITLTQTFSNTSSGSSTISGSGSITQIMNVSNSGGTILSGTSPALITFNNTNSGGIITSGSSTVAQVFTNSSSGKAIASGSGSTAQTFVIASSGKASASGISNINWTGINSGGVITTGSGSLGQSFSGSSSGGIALSGSNYPSVIVLGSGSIIVSGNGNGVVVAAGEITSGGVTASGSYVSTTTVNTSSTGGIATTGISTPTIVYNIASNGGILSGGSSTITQVFAYSSVQTVSVAGSSIVSVWSIGSGGTVVSGQSYPNITISNSGGVITGGLSTVSSSIYSSGGATVSGNATCQMNFLFSTSGGIIASGTGTPAFVSLTDIPYYYHLTFENIVLLNGTTFTDVNLL